MIASPPDTARGTEARRLIRAATHAALGTSQDGRPYVSLVAVAADHDGSPLLLLSDLAQHSRNIAAEPRVSLLFPDVAAQGDPLAAARLSLLGRTERCDEPRLMRRFTARHPGSAAYAGFADFRLYRVAIERGHLVAGFGRISWVEQDRLRFGEDAGALAAAEDEIVAHMNADHADAVALFAARLLSRSASGWRMSGIDPEGIDLVLHKGEGSETARLDFPGPVLTPTEARAALIGLTRTARDQPGG